MYTFFYVPITRMHAYTTKPPTTTHPSIRTHLPSGNCPLPPHTYTPKINDRHFEKWGGGKVVWCALQLWCIQALVGGECSVGVVQLRTCA